MRRHFMRKFVLIRALFIASVVTLAVLLGGFLWGGTGGGRA